MTTAIVVGASMAGLCAARVLADRFDRVEIIDRDTLPDGPDWRAQVPQARQPHLLLVAGARLLEQWFPGISAELQSLGAIDLDICGDVYWYQCGGVARRPRTQLRGPCMSRPLLEWQVRSRLAHLPNVTVHPSATVSGLDFDGGKVRAVRLTDGTTHRCDLVVDATGRQARSIGWLEAAGFAGPAVSTVEIDMCYVSRIFRRTPDPDRDWHMAVLVGDPATKRIAMVLPLEDDRWIVSLAGFNGERPPTEHDGMVAFARGLGPPVIADIMSSEPLSEPSTYRYRANQRRHVEKLRRFPTGWVLAGDALCSFDPIYGQGMTSAAQQAAALGECLDAAGGVSHTFARRYFRAASRTVAAPWAIAVGGDFAYPGTKGKKPAGTDLFNRYFDRMNVAAQHDDEITVRVNEVLSLLRGSGSLLTPPIMWRVWRGARRGPVGAGLVPATYRS